MKTRLFWIAWACLVLTLFYMQRPSQAADNMIPGAEFASATGLQSGATLEDLVSQSTFARSAFDPLNTNRLFDSTTITNVLSNGVYIAAVADGGITAAKLAKGAVEGSKLGVSSVSNDKIATGAVSWASLNTNILARTNEFLSYSVTVYGARPTGWSLTNAAPWVAFTGRVLSASSIDTNLWDGSAYTCVYDGMYYISAWMTARTIWPSYTNWYRMLILANSNVVGGNDYITAYPSNETYVFGQRVSYDRILSLTNGERIQFSGDGSPAVSTAYVWSATIHYIGK